MGGFRLAPRPCAAMNAGGYVLGLAWARGRLVPSVPKSAGDRVTPRHRPIGEEWRVERA